MACSTALEFTVPARDGYKLSVVTSATTETDDAVLLLHGRTWSSGPVWQTTGAIDTLGRAAYAVDFRGFGRTPTRAPDGLLKPSTCVDDVCDMLQELRTKHKKVHLLGWSYGGLVAQKVAAASSLVDRLVLYSSVWDPEGADPQCADWAALREFGVDLGAVKCPTLVVHGDKDPYASIATQRALFNTLGSAEKSLVVIDASDHVAHALTRPKVQWAGAINAFLDA